MAGMSTEPHGPHASLDELEDHDRGLRFDRIVLGRRRMLAFAGGAGVAALLAACGSKSSGSTATAPATDAAAITAAGEIPEETAGPYPADGSNGVNVLSEDGVVRSDITSSFGSSSGTAEGVPLTIDLTVTDASSGEALSGAAVYLWHADRDGKYSLYSEGVTDQNYLRGVQPAGDDGTLSFTSIFPACYDGRWPHIHFEVYASVDDAIGGGGRSAPPDRAPQDICDTVYATDGYEQSVTNLSRVRWPRTTCSATA